MTIRAYTKSTRSDKRQTIGFRWSYGSTAQSDQGVQWGALILAALACQLWGTMKQSLLFSSVLVALFLAVPALPETFEAKGTVTTYSDVMRPGEACETSAANLCKPGQPCFARIVIEGQAARALYDAMKLHSPKFSEVSGSNYLGTQTNAMTCWEINGAYSCDIGYDALENVLSETKSCQYE